MAFVAAVTLAARGIALVPLALAHEEGLRAAVQVVPISRRLCVASTFL